jgi:hypothetical protein
MLFLSTKYCDAFIFSEYRLSNASDAADGTGRISTAHGPDAHDARPDAYDARPDATDDARTYGSSWSDALPRTVA